MGDGRVIIGYSSGNFVCNYSSIQRIKKTKKMKRFTSIILFAILCYAASAQTYLYEDFGAGVMPPAGWSIEGLENQWSVAATNEAGGTPPEGKFSWIQETSATRLISPAVNLSGLTTVTLMFNHYYDYFAPPAPLLRVATRNGTGNWNTVWEITPTNNVGPEPVVISISNANVGQPDFQFCIYLEGNFYNLDYWHVDDIKLFTPLPVDAALTSIELPAYIEVNDQVELSGSVKNWGSDPVTSFDISYTIDGGAPFVQNYSGLSIAMGNSYDFVHDDTLSFSASGSYHVVVNVGNVNGSNDPNPSNDTLDTFVGVVPWVPVKKVFCEEATGTWCGWCVRGICFMDQMAETYPDTWIGAAVHNDDPMTNTVWDNAIPEIIPSFSGYPSGTIDRVEQWDPEDFEEGYLEQISTISPGSVSIYNFSYDPTTRIVNFDVESEFVVDTYNELRFGAVIIENDIHGTTSEYNQHNYYSGGGNGPMCGFEGLPDPVPAADMYYNHVGRDILDSPFGTEGSIPTPALAGMKYNHHYTYTLPEEWNFSKLTFVGLLMDQTNGTILNTNNIVYWVGEKELIKAIDLNVFPNPFSETAFVSFSLDNPSDVGFRVSDFTGRTVIQGNTRRFGAGDNMIRIQGDHLQNGIYFVELRIEEMVYTRKVVVNK